MRKAFFWGFPPQDLLFRLYPDLSLSFGIDGCGPLHGERNALL